jgi:hypothetical protein
MSFLPGQYISFAIETQGDFKTPEYTYAYVKKGKRTFMKIAASLGHPELAREIADLNGERNRYKILPIGFKIRVPGVARKSDTFKVLAGDSPPTITDGYASWDVVDRSQRSGVTVFRGYSPITMSVPIRFEAFLDGTQVDGHTYSGAQIERDISLLERMAGRGAFKGAAVGPPPVVRVSTTGARGEVVPLIPFNYQFSDQNTTPPVWVITGLEWDEDALRNNDGLRIRQLATVTLTQFTGAPILRASASERHKAKTITYTTGFVGPNTTP